MVAGSYLLIMGVLPGGGLGEFSPSSRAGLSLLTTGGSPVEVVLLWAATDNGETLGRNLWKGIALVQGSRVAQTLWACQSWLHCCRTLWVEAVSNLVSGEGAGLVLV